MVEQPHTSLRSPCAMPSVGGSGVKLAAIGLQSGNGPVAPVKGNLNATAEHITLWQQFGEGPFLYQHDNEPVHKARSIQKWFVEIGVEELDWPAQSPDFNPIAHLRDELESRSSNI